ncbi:mitochondrial import inner membrane translocase subunit Tim21-like isoform X3 [Penaeus chinensis]|uniref:mitochondrial import inner membrane translocase subunit Tim21-like isoform X3 n=1 Tax=Penaeus chinensis TaxID=139456 RepID=UPI001FB72CE4|nr:mitochondrial import inner membrane translocase subunit Tim21-like isoform X3 [Penaeus chinensis]
MSEMKKISCVKCYWRDPNMIPLISLKMSWCQRCVTSQSAIQVWGSLIRKHQFSTTYVPFNIRKSVSKQVKSDSSGSFGEKAKEATRTTSYTAVVLVGVGVTGLMLYSVFKELLSSFSPQSVYSAAVEKCIANSRVVDLLGDSVKSYGEESRRGRRQHIRHPQVGSFDICLYSLMLIHMKLLLLKIIEENHQSQVQCFPAKQIFQHCHQSSSGVGFLTPIFPSK